jgi:hypothetical protein
MTSDDAFAAEVDRLLEETLGKLPHTFAALVSRLPGVDPAIVRARLERAPALLRDRVNWSPVPPATEPSDTRLPIPHPLDFDWRFSESTRGALARELIESGPHVLLLGAPSVWLALHNEPHPLAHVTLVDRTALAAPAGSRATYHHVLADLLGDPLPALLSHADVVLADPPWYPEATAHFLWAAARLSRLGSRLLLSVAPVGTRPGIREERAAFFAFAEQLGYTLRETRPASLGYAMPPFERNALRAAGLSEFVPFDWRRGDLLVFEHTRLGEGTRPLRAAAPAVWAERVLGGVRLRVRPDQDAGDDPRLQSLVEGDILPSVSRRDLRRSQARLWTSGNRVFGCAAPSLLLRVLDEQDLKDGGDRPPSAWVREAREAVKTVVEREREEYICSKNART